MVPVTENIAVDMGVKELASSGSGKSKKMATQNCSYDMLVQLYKLGFVEARS